MISSQKFDAITRSNLAEHEVALRWTHDEEMALGCECADPVLQIEQWSLDQAQTQAQPQR